LRKDWTAQISLKWLRKLAWARIGFSTRFTATMRRISPHSESSALNSIGLPRRAVGGVVSSRPGSSRISSAGLLDLIRDPPLPFLLSRRTRHD
jgi:hypothetical protein